MDLSSLKDRYPDYRTDAAQGAALWQALAPSLANEPFETHWQACQDLFGTDRPAPVWQPNEESLRASNIGTWLEELSLPDYEALYRWSVENKAAFWEKAAQTLKIRFAEPYESVLDDAKGSEMAQWFKGAKLNIVDSIFTPENAKRTALWAGNERNETRSFTYAELESQVNRLANGLNQQRLKPGDKIVFYVPLSAESVVAYLGTLKAGMIPLLVADSFSPQELKKRSEILGAEAVFCYDSYLYGGKDLSIYHKVKDAEATRAFVIHGGGERQPLREGDLYFEELLSDNQAFTSVKASPDDTACVLFSSGTTKAPKAIPWTHLTAIKGAVDAHLHHDVKPADVVTWTTSMGWMMGPWAVFAGLLNGAATAVFNGAGATEAFRDFALKSKITMMGTIPSLVRVWRKRKLFEGVEHSIRLFSSTGEPSNAEDYLYLMSLAGYQAPVIEYCGGTEIGGGYITGSVAQVAAPATFTTPALGTELLLLNEKMQRAEAGETGQVFIVPPTVGLSQKLLNRDHHEEYYAGLPEGPEGQTLRRHGDAIDIDETSVNGKPFRFYKSHGRVDDAMNIGGIKVSAVEIEEAVGKHEAVFEAAAVSVQRSGATEALYICYVPAPDAQAEDDTLRKELQQIVSDQINPLFRISKVVKMDKLPRTASNKVMRRSLRAQLQSETPND